MQPSCLLFCENSLARWLFCLYSVIQKMWWSEINGNQKGICWVQSFWKCYHRVFCELKELIRRGLSTAGPEIKIPEDCDRNLPTKTGMEKKHLPFNCTVKILQFFTCFRINCKFTGFFTLFFYKMIFNVLWLLEV